MLCPYCGHYKSTVQLTERFQSLIRRRRVCLSCDGRWYTTEEFLAIIRPPPQWSPEAHPESPAAASLVKEGTVYVSHPPSSPAKAG